MDNLKIAVIEDDLLIAESIVQMLQQVGYRTIEPVCNYEDAIKVLETESPDLLLIDIILDGRLDGIDLAKKVREQNTAPFIFITANSDRATVQRAKEVRPYAYLVKPFNERNLYSSIEVAFSTFNHEVESANKPRQKGPGPDDFIFIKENHLFHKVMTSEILYIESESVYLNIYTAKKNYVVRTKLSDFLSTFSNGDFFRVHRSYAVNIKHLQTINNLSVKVADREIPLSLPYKQDLLKTFRSL